MALHDLDCHQAGRQAACGKPSHHIPVDTLLPDEARHGSGLGECRKQQVGADGQMRFDSENQNQQGRHQ